MRLASEVCEHCLSISKTCMSAQANVVLRKNSMQSAIMHRKLSLRQCLEQDEVEDAAMRSIIMCRFLRAAQEVAHHEHEGSITSPPRKNRSKSPSPSVRQQLRRIAIVNCTESKTRRLSKGSAISPPKLHSRHREESMLRSMSHGLLCLGLKALSSCMCRTGDSTSGRSMSGKLNGYDAHPLYHMKVAHRGTSSLSSEMKGAGALKKKPMGGTLSEHLSGINVDVPVLHPSRSPEDAYAKKRRRRRAMKYLASISSSSSPYSRPPKEHLAGNQIDSLKSKQSPYDDHVWMRNFATMARNEQETETETETVEEMSTTPSDRNHKSTRVYSHVENLSPLDLAGEDITSTSSTTSQGDIGGSETPRRKAVNEDGDCDKVNDEPCQFCDALSSLDSAKSNSTFYTFESPTSESEVLGLEGERLKNEMESTDASRHSPHAPASKNNSVPLHVRTGSEEGMHEKMHSLSKRIGRDSKLDTESKQAKHRYDRSVSRLRHRSLDSLNGLYPLSASAIFPVLPAKCQNDEPNSCGWPFGISNPSSRVGSRRSSGDYMQVRESNDKLAVGGNVGARPPLPPAPTASWLGHAIMKNTSKTTLLAVLQQKEKAASARRKLESQSLDLDAEPKLDFQSASSAEPERRWEDVVKGSQVHVGHLRYSEELRILMRTSL